MPKGIKKRKNRRNQVKYPAVRPDLNLKTRYEEITDVASYFNTLPEDAKKWIHSYTEEAINANFNHKGRKIIRKVEDKRAIYNRNNARNRDILTRAKASGQYVEIDNPMNKKNFLTGHRLEDALIAKIDHENKAKRKKKASA